MWIFKDYYSGIRYVGWIEGGSHCGYPGHPVITQAGENGSPGYGGGGGTGEESMVTEHFKSPSPGASENHLTMPSLIIAVCFSNPEKIKFKCTPRLF